MEVCAVLTVAKKKSNPAAVVFGERLRRIREQKGLSVSDAALAAGLAYSAFHRYERGEREPSLTTLLKLATALGVSAADLLTGGDDPAA